MPINSRNKGKRGEREVIDILQPTVDEVYHAHARDTIPILQRNTVQSDSGGYDIIGLDWLAIEVKRCQRLEVNKWWEQAVRQAGAEKEPVLFFRRDFEKRWSVRMFGQLQTKEIGGGFCFRTFTVPVTVDIDCFMGWFRSQLHGVLTYED